MDHPTRLKDSSDASSSVSWTDRFSGHRLPFYSIAHTINSTIFTAWCISTVFSSLRCGSSAHPFSESLWQSSTEPHVPIHRAQTIIAGVRILE